MTIQYNDTRITSIFIFQNSGSYYIFFFGVGLNFPCGKTYLHQSTCSSLLCFDFVFNQSSLLSSSIQLYSNMLPKYISLLYIIHYKSLVELSIVCMYRFTSGIIMIIIIDKKPLCVIWKMFPQSTISKMHILESK